ncbi:MAG: SMP-30/gluconolactonase/LRE family protein [Betaproteobacteria bacterium]|nr:MAG: SMP-30/gluconolactonase/LRE family protein [Betaproteobacteria bacterium]
MSTRLKVPVECVIDARNTTGESPLWSAREAALYWVDIPEGRIFRWQPKTGERRTWQLPAPVGSIGLRERGGLVTAMRTGFHLFDLETEQLTFLCHPEPDIATNPTSTDWMPTTAVRALRAASKCPTGWHGVRTAARCTTRILAAV